jgi:hypothetical protein
MDSRISVAYAAFSRADQEEYKTGAPATSSWGGALSGGAILWDKFNPNAVARIIPAGIKNVIFKYVLILPACCSLIVSAIVCYYFCHL